ncbi:CHAP domain-containing protein [Streptomyces sp. NBC_01180]|uniref:CHAP domain-containing protein n=1 Tax=Streptomyces sp. NBC_01180 TaxID=2903763 RepID=UPI00386692AA|nr:CHAP domain-containing protein [Streptomyces sp. NBC_01180]
MTATAAGVIKIASAEVGYHEGRSGGHWNNNEKYAAQVPGLSWANYQAWCATFVSYCAYKAGAASLFPSTASCATGVAWFKSRKRWSEYPAVGAQVFYGPGGGSHTGIVVAYDSATITTIEGNTNTNGSAEGDGVYRKTRQRRDNYVYGYGYPAYAEGIKSADPAYAGKAPASPPSVSLAAVVYGATHSAKDESKHAANADDVRHVQDALIARGRLKNGADTPGVFGIPTKAAYAAEQRAQGYKGHDADGVPGKASLTKLGSGRFKVVS